MLNPYLYNEKSCTAAIQHFAFERILGICSYDTLGNIHREMYFDVEGNLQQNTYGYDEVKRELENTRKQLDACRKRNQGQ